MKRNILILLFTLLLPIKTYAGEVKNLIKTDSSWDGNKIVYPKGDAEINSFYIKLDKGESLPFHCHPIPTIGYILSGELEVEKMDGTRKIFKQGEAISEVTNIWHRGHNISKTKILEILVFYLGTSNTPVQIPYNEENKTKCKVG